MTNMITILAHAIKSIDKSLEKAKKQLEKLAQKEQTMNGNAKISSRSAKTQRQTELLLLEISDLERAKKTAYFLIKDSQHHENYYRTVVNSPQWQAWVKHQEEVQEWDVHESMECGWLSQAHFQAFLNWNYKNLIK